MVTDEQVRWLASTMAARMLTNAGSKERHEQLMEAVGHWFPGDDGLPLNELSEVANRVGAYFGSLATLIEIRTVRLAGQEPPAAVPLPACKVIP